MHLRIATYNIHRCTGLDGFASPERIGLVLREIDADIIALQEVAAEPGAPDNALNHLARTTGAEAVEGFTLAEPDLRYGNAVLSRETVLGVNRLDISVPGREPRGLLEIELGRRDRRIALFATHLGLAPRERRRQVRRILSHLHAHTAHTLILLGDFNEWFLWGRPLRALSRYFARSPSPPTFPARFPLLCLDRFWIRPPHRLVSLRAHITRLSRVASDHLPLVADVVV